MILRMCTLSFLFLKRLRIPSSKSILKFIKDRYGESVLKLFRKFERTRYTLSKNGIRFEFFEALFRKLFNTKVFTF